MRIIITFILFTLSAHSVFSQLILTSQFNPVPGDVDSYAICDTANIFQGPSGANQTWNFPNLTKIDSSDVHMVAASSTPYAGLFPSSNVASTNDNISYNYVTTSASNYLVNGNGSPDLVISYSNPQLFMQYPFTYNSSFSDNFGANYISNGIPTVRTGTITVTGDAWGTINLPIGSFPNALRVKDVIITKDSSNQGAPVVFITSLTSYIWFVPGKKFPVLEIIYTTLLFNGIPIASSKTVNYNPHSTPIGIQQISSEVPGDYTLSQNYPNPFNPETIIRFQIGRLSDVKLIVFDIRGRQVTELLNRNMNTGTYEVDWNASNYPSGVYYYRLSAGDYSETKKMILIK